MDSTTDSTKPPAETNAAPAADTHHKLTQVVVSNEVDALNLLVQFIGLAQRRGAYTIDEAAKIWECVKFFQKPVAAPAP